ncbi:unnamed protein product [Rhizoctonia solani]|uniref:F-box domain-containing protein n=1 Tax=Rhizoctonia solani TaxID=456999 RepID=A0A8H3AKI2_9AGAM|nr:unnamed protein product [Rhizoctonia solani]
MSKVAANFRDCCSALKDAPFIDHADADAINAIIDFSPSDMDSLIVQPLLVARSSLARCRNKAVSKIYALPPEVLLAVFSFVIHDFQTTQPVKSGTLGVYRRLHTLVAVCSVWRNICMSHGILWSLIPLFHTGSNNFPTPETLRNLHRAAGNSKLHLVAQLGHCAPSNDILGEWISREKRVATINLTCQSRSTTRSILEYFLDNPTSTLSSVTQLSICSMLEGYSRAEAGSEDPRLIFSRQSEYQAKLPRLVESLRSLRIRNTYFHLADMKFFNLVELRIQDLRFGSTITVLELFQSIFSASNLRIFHITSVFAHCEPDDEIMSNPGFSCQELSFPNLQRLWIEDVRINVLKALFLSIKPGRYETSIRLSGAWYCPGRFLGAKSQESLESVFRNINISSLLIARHLDDWNNIHWLLKSIPTLTSLFIDGQVFEERIYEGLARSSHAGSNSVDYTGNFPAIRDLHITRARIFDPEGFRTFVGSHPTIHRMTLGASILKRSQGWENCTPGSKTGKWFLAVLPGLHLVDFDETPAGFHSSTWGLWGPLSGSAP